MKPNRYRILEMSGVYKVQVLRTKKLGTDWRPKGEMEYWDDLGLPRNIPAVFDTLKAARAFVAKRKENPVGEWTVVEEV